MGELLINKDSFKELQKMYDQAKSDKAESFNFQSKEILTSYAKYMIEYLKPQIEKL